ncbi:DUF4157 domain-containing protein [Streptomyces sp. MW-W600-10]|uniref:eCIS core domain-containing protein n=1 Tax=Streptomyces TaxID=1883 RepID=UPI001C437FB8|nr:DUF4157 domain-containing protein [Streptomyces sp. MW-W600-10]MBV7248291.1 DUF4157 domain-containing protein [Streptomyces sp. MW-W600-10]
MHSQDGPAKTGAESRSAPVARKPEAASGVPPTGLLALQGSVGNAAVVQMMRTPDRSALQDQDHEHGDGCGHGRADQAPVQRSAVHDVLRGAGRPLDSATRTDMESRLGADFSDVRIHNNAAAKASAAEIGARAYTSGSHVVIGNGGADKHTLAHELTHVIQQRQGQVAGTDNGRGLRVSDPSDRFEREAEANARRVMSGPAAAGPDVQRAVSTRSPGAAAPAVQRTVQDRLTDAYWADQAAGKKAVKAPTKASGGRRGDEILQVVGPGLIEELAALCAGKSEEELNAMGRLELFRTMDESEAADIEAWWAGHGDSTAKLNDMNQWIVDHKDDEKPSSAFNKQFGETKKTAAPGAAPKDGTLPIGNHLGDEEQARSYLDPKRPGEQALMKFVLRPGAHELLFSPQYMAVDGNAAKRTPQSLRNIHGGMPQAKKGEGLLDGYVGIKQENRGDFSVAVSSKWSKLLFQIFVERIERA